MKESSEFPFEQNDNETILVERFEKMLSSGDLLFFDVDEFEDLIDYYSIRNKVDNAFLAISMAKSQHPSSNTFMLKEAELLAFSNKPFEALKTIEKLELIEGPTADITLTKASIFSQQGRYNQAIKTLKDALKLPEADAESIYMSLSFEYQNVSKFEKAIKCLKSVLKINHKNEDALYELAYCYDITDQQEVGVSFYKKFIDQHPYNRHAWYNLGNSYTSLKKYDLAIEAYDYAIVIKDNFSSAHFNKANILARIERYEEAIEVYQYCLKLEKGGAITNFYLAECYYNINQFTQALKYYKLATKADPNYSEAWLGIAVSLDQLDAVEQAIPYMEKAVNIDPYNLDALLTLAEGYSRTGEKFLASETYKKACLVDDNDPETFIEASDFFIDEDLADNAIEILNDGIKRNPALAELFYKLAAVLLQIGEPSKALSILQEGLDLAPELHALIFDYFADADKNQDIIDLIELYKNLK